MAAHVPVEDLPFAGELIEVKAEHREWTGAIERLLHQFGVSLLVPERHYVAVSEFINRQHLGLRFTFHRVSSAAASRTDTSSDSTRVTPEEHRAYQRVRAGKLLLEQEKIPHTYAVHMLSSLTH